MITRRIFIVGSPVNEDYSFQMGVKADVINYQRYFKSPIGGAFNPDEITVLKNPSWKRLKAQLLALPADFTIFIFSGHGFFATNTQKAVFNINENDAVAAQTIINHIQSTKKLIIFDACQSYLEAYHYLEGIGDVEQYMNFRSSVPKLRARQLFNEAILDNPDGAQILMSCSRGQESVLSPTGSFFSYALLTSSQNWSNTNSRETVLTTLQAGKMTTNFLKKNYSSDQTNQRPSCFVTRLRPNFPIGVKHASLQLLY
ncbi:MAG TPA: caspase family protein [Bacteroidia bacterium]|jgi:hypothetical protein|nr:caspase family protein [Bacteroidia bacterium]